MARNQQSDVQSGILGWDATLNDNIDVMQENPIPIVEYTTIGDIPAPTLHDRSLAMGNHLERGWCPFFSDGVIWVAARPYHVIQPLIVSEGGTVSTANFKWDVHDTISDLGIPMLANGRIVSFAIGTTHVNGESPTSWTLRVKNITTSTTVTAAVNWNPADSTWTSTVNKFSAQLVVNVGDEIGVFMDGFSISNIKANLVLMVDLDLTTTTSTA